MSERQTSYQPQSDRLLVNPDAAVSLARLDHNDVSEARGEVRVFGNIKNEALMLPYFFEYYRRLGIDRFFLVDDHSTDGSREYCLSQHDVHVFEPSNSFADSGCGTNWHNLLLDRFGTGFWTLLVDADELLVYPHCEKIGLPELCAFLDSQGHSALFSFLLDMYSESSISRAKYKPGLPFLNICPYHDIDYLFLSWSFDEGSKSSCDWPARSVRGGPRTRLFYPLQRHRNILTRALTKAAIVTGKVLPFLYGDDRPHGAPTLVKTNLIKWHHGCERYDNHYVKKTPELSLAPITGALLHFKFFSEFFEKASRESESKQHFNGGQEYRRYLSYIKCHGDFSFFHRGSRRYENSLSLLNQGLLFSTKSYDDFVNRGE
jgi:hypothetical protein